MSKKRWVALRSPILRALEFMVAKTAFPSLLARILAFRKSQTTRFRILHISLIIQTIFYTPDAQAQTINTFYSAAICQSIQSAVHHLPENANAFEWPRTMRITGVMFPKWTKLDPSQSLNLVEENYVTEQTEYQDLELAEPAPGVRKTLFESQEQIEFGWNRFAKPEYLRAISAHTFEFQRTTLSGISGQEHKIIVFGFRERPAHRTNIQIRMTPIDGRYSWEYLLRIYGQGGSYKDYPVASSSNSIQGELAII